MFSPVASHRSSRNWKWVLVFMRCNLIELGIAPDVPESDDEPTASELSNDYQVARERNCRGGSFSEHETPPGLVAQPSARRGFCVTTTFAYPNLLQSRAWRPALPGSCS